MISLTTDGPGWLGDGEMASRLALAQQMSELLLGVRRFYSVAKKRSENAENTAA